VTLSLVAWADIRQGLQFMLHDSSQ